jgi:hypothetical protein
LEQTFNRLGIKLRPLNAKNPREFMEFQRLMCETNPSFVPFNPIAIQNVSRFKAFINHIFYRLFKARIFVGIDATGEMVLFMSYMPDVNVAIKCSNIDWSRKRLSNVYPLLKLPFTFRRTKVCRELGFGMLAPKPPSSPSYFSSYLEVCHKLGIEPLEQKSGGEYMKMENAKYFPYLMRKDGFEELVAGVQTTNVSMQYLQGFFGKYESVTPVGKYATLAYNFR